MNKRSMWSAALLLFLVVSLFAVNTHAGEVVASIKDIRGQIEIERKQNRITAKNGLILYDKDAIVTGENARATIIFRDGTIIRLFANTRFLIERSVEIKKGSRLFLHNFMLKLGSFWGKFSKKYQKTTIRTPTATAGIKGTIIAMSEHHKHLDVSLTTGTVSLRNERETINLKPGQMARSLTKQGLMSDKIQALPYALVFKADEAEINLPDSGDAIETYFTVQMVRKSINKNASRSGPVYISHEFDNIQFESDIRLNSRGYARIKASVLPFKSRNSMRETITITAVMDGEDFIDVDAGQTSLTIIQMGNGSKTLKIDVNSDKIE